MSISVKVMEETLFDLLEKAENDYGTEKQKMLKDEKLLKKVAAYLKLIFIFKHPISEREMAKKNKIDWNKEAVNQIQVFLNTSSLEKLNDEEYFETLSLYQKIKVELDKLLEERNIKAL